MAELAERRAGRNGRREGKAMLRTQSREAPSGLDAGPERSGTAVPKGCRHNRSEEPDALARPSGSVRGPSGNRRATATVAECEIDASVVITTRRLLHPSTSVPKNKVQCREGRSLPRLVADYATAGQSDQARCASRRACRRATCAGACMLRGKRVRARSRSP